MALLLAQIDLQQQVRDRWFGFYILISGGTLTASLAGLTLLGEFLTSRSLTVLCALPLAFSSILGMLFLNIYLYQRRNYANHYAALVEIQRKLVASLLSRPYNTYYPLLTPFLRSPRGADYYTVWVLILISAFYSGMAAGLAVSTILPTAITVAAASFTALSACIILNAYRQAFERRNNQ